MHSLVNEPDLVNLYSLQSRKQCEISIVQETRFVTINVYLYNIIKLLLEIFLTFCFSLSLKHYVHLSLIYTQYSV